MSSQTASTCSKVATGKQPVCEVAHVGGGFGNMRQRDTSAPSGRSLTKLQSALHRELKRRAASANKHTSIKAPKEICQELQLQIHGGRWDGRRPGRRASQSKVDTRALKGTLPGESRSRQCHRISVEATGPRHEEDSLDECEGVFHLEL